ncbi:hypothetical protein L873DRAFT_1788703 [Choiromyces venosus 120613-1]|uniref:Uncharacterized protein n=1 Tax=Choiromyces venosus 120613-1 TaxID=1336337 RepID=A0A3N4K4B8_9PEZI|nr:hypothetical protein L873DRAFT_1788703 [Choiromyces venosus 120613-1]
MCRHITLHFNCNHYNLILTPSSKSCYIHDQLLLIETNFLTTSHEVTFSLVLINSWCRPCTRDRPPAGESVDGVANWEQTILRTIPEEVGEMEKAEGTMDITFTAVLEGRTEVGFGGVRLSGNTNLSFNSARKWDGQWWEKHDDMDIEETWSQSPPVAEEEVEEMEEIDWWPDVEVGDPGNDSSGVDEEGRLVSRNF